MRDAREALGRAAGSRTLAGPPPKALRHPGEKRRFRLVPDFLLRPSLQPVFAGATGLLVFISFLAFSPAGRTFQKSFNRQLHVGYSTVEKLYAKAGSLTDEIGLLQGNDPRLPQERRSS